MAFREMRRCKQALERTVVEDILRRGSSGVLAVLGDDAYPYAVPLSYVYADGKLYFHGAKEGHKIDAIRQHAKASFCVIDRDAVVPEEGREKLKNVLTEEEYSRITATSDFKVSWFFWQRK